jgi:hypothetical protein
VGDIVGPVPKVFRVRTTNSLTISIFLAVFYGAFLSIWISGAILAFTNHPVSSRQWLQISVGIGGIGISIFLVRLVKSNFTSARIEVIGSEILTYDRLGILELQDDLTQIAAIYNSQVKRYRRLPVEHYHVLFASGNLLNFDQYLENDFTLQKMLKSHAQCDFQLISREDIELLALETKNSRASKVKRLPKSLEK